MRILFLSHYFQPEAEYFYGLPFARKLVERGHRVEVLTCVPNYPLGRVYDGYRMRLLQRETLEGVPIIRVPLLPSHDRSAVRRIANYASFGITASTIGTFAVRPADVVYCIQGPITLGLPAFALRYLRGIPFVHNIQDLWPDTLASTGMFDSRVGLKLVNVCCNVMYGRASRVVTFTPGVKRLLCERGIPEHKIEVVYNWCDDSQFAAGPVDPAVREEFGFDGRFNVVFAGNMGRAQELAPVLDAAPLVARDHPEVQFVFIGKGLDVERLKSKKERMQLDNVRFFDRQPVERIGGILRAAEALLVHLRDDPLFRITIPSKTQAYMAIGRPILMGVKGDAEDLMARSGAGVVCEPCNPESIASAVRELASLPKERLEAVGRSAREFYERELSIDRAARQYERIFEAAARGRSGSRARG
jgi:glycosyltransferase involved in cell wall biosynthesis